MFNSLLAGAGGHSGETLWAQLLNTAGILWLLVAGIPEVIHHCKAAFRSIQAKLIRK